jgi:uncharacterized membrane protein YciS (DUF1049 family)
MKFIVYLIFLNGVLLGDPWGTSHPYGTANRTFFGPEKRSDSSPEDIKRIEERRDTEERLKIESSRRWDIQNESQNKESSEYKKDYASTQYSQKHLNEESKDLALKKANDCQVVINYLVKQSTYEKDKEAFLEVDCYKDFRTFELIKARNTYAARQDPFLSTMGLLFISVFIVPFVIGPIVYSIFKKIRGIE